MILTLISPNFAYFSALFAPLLVHCGILMVFNEHNIYYFSFLITQATHTLLQQLKKSIWVQIEDFVIFFLLKIFAKPFDIHQ